MASAFELSFIGGGNMAEGILAAVIQRGVHPAGKIIVAEPVAERRRVLTEQFGVAVTDDNGQAAAQSRRVILAVKPQNFADVAAGISDAVRGDHLLISILAVVSTRRSRPHFRTQRTGAASHAQPAHPRRGRAWPA